MMTPGRLRGKGQIRLLILGSWGESPRGPRSEAEVRPHAPRRARLAPMGRGAVLGEDRCHGLGYTLPISTRCHASAVRRKYAAGIPHPTSEGSEASRGTRTDPT